MQTLARYVLLPLVAALTLVTAPAEAIWIDSGPSVGAAQPSQPQQLSKKQLTKQRKLQKTCAKLAAGKIKKAETRAKYQKLCAKPAAPAVPAEPAQGGGGSGPVLDEGEDATPPDETGGTGGNSGSVGQPNPGGGYVDEIPDLPPVFTPPVFTPPGGGGQPGEDTPAAGALPQLPLPAVGALRPTHSVPEPGSLALLGLGLMGLGLTRRRK